MHKPLASPFRFIGTPLPRKEDARLTTGAGRFSDDFSMPGQWLGLRGDGALAATRTRRIRGVDFAACARPCPACSASSPAPIASPPD